MTCPNCPLCLCKDESIWLSRTPTFRSTIAGIWIGLALVAMLFLLAWIFSPPCRGEWKSIASGHVGPIVVSLSRCESPDGGRP